MDVIDKYHQMVRMGPRRSGRTVGNVLSAANAAGKYGKATIVVAQDGMIPQVNKDIVDYIGHGPLADSINVTSLGRVQAYSGPFMLDHYAVDKVVSTLVKEITFLRARMQENEARFIG